MKNFVKERKFARKDLEKSELKDKKEMHKLEETTIQDILPEIGHHIRNNNNY